MKNVWCSCLILLIVAPIAFAAENEVEKKDPNDPEKLMRVKWDAIVKVLQNDKFDKAAKIKHIDKIIDPLFDFPLMAKLALGREHWPKLNAAQREKFSKLFVKLLKETYREKISLYTNEELLFKPPLKKTKTVIQIPAELMYKDKKVTMLYKLRKLEKRWKIYDVEIQGVSVLLTYRSQFDDILSNSTVEDLLSRLEKPKAPAD